MFPQCGPPPCSCLPPPNPLTPPTPTRAQVPFGSPQLFYCVLAADPSALIPIDGIALFKNRFKGDSIWSLLKCFKDVMVLENLFASEFEKKMCILLFCLFLKRPTTVFLVSPKQKNE